MNKYDYQTHPQGVVCVAVPYGKNTYKVNWKKQKSFKQFKIRASLHGVQNLYMPDPSTFTGELAKVEDFVSSDGEHIKQINPHGAEISKQRLWTGVQAEGCELHPGDVLALGTADCFTISASHPNHPLHSYGFMAGCHAGLGSIVDLKYLLYGQEKRLHFSVVDSLMDLVDAYALSKKDLRVGLHCGISWKHFTYPYNHKVHGPANKKLIKFLRSEYGENASPTRLRFKDQESGKTFIKKVASRGHINLREIIECQFERRGVSKDQIYHDGIDTGVPFEKRKLVTQYVSHAKGTDVRVDMKKGKRKERILRNLVMVSHLREPLFEEKKKKY